MKRPLDLLAAGAFSVFFLLPMLAIAALVKITSKGPVLYWSDRIGKDNRIFRMPKFRTMRTDTPPVATHLLSNPESYLTPVGSFLRRFSLDELPQLWTLVTGDMTLIGPRPALFNQDDLIRMRTQKGIHRLVPGITGWAQINGRDELSILEKVRLEEYYLNHRGWRMDIQILWLTLIKVIRTEGIKH